MQSALTPLEQQQLDVAGASSAGFWHRVRFDLVAHIVAEVDARRVIDVGAGSGLLGEHLRGMPVTGAVEYRFTESSASLRAVLVERFGVGAERTAGEHVDAASVVTLLDVIEHVDDDAAMLDDLHRSMAAGATLVVTVPAMRWLFSSWDTDLGHRRRYHRRDAASVVRGAGFEVEEASYLFPELVPIALLRRWRRSDGDHADFPELPAWLDRVAARVGRVSTRLRRIWPVGTSVVVVARSTGRHR